MKALGIAATLGAFAVLLSCAGQPKPVAQQEDPRIGHLQGQVDNLQKQLTAKDASIKDLQSQVAALQQQVNPKETTIMDLQDQAKALKQQLDDKDAAIARLTKEAEGLSAQLGQLGSQKQNADDQVAASSQRLKQLQGQLDDLRLDDATKLAQLDSLNSKILALEKSDSDLSADIASLRSGTTKTDADYLAEIDSLKGEKAALQDRIDELGRQNAALGVAAQRDEKDLEARIAQLNSLFAKEMAQGDIDIRRFRNILIVSVKDEVLFPPDSPKLRPEMLGVLLRLSQVFKAAPDRVVRIEGNTAVAISSPETLRLYPTSWHLGAARAANVAEYLQEKCGVDPMQLVAASLGEYRPRADNSTEEGKAQNRRVDFVMVARDIYEIDQLQSVAAKDD